MSDLQDVSGPTNGYYIRMGESGSDDGIDLFKTGTSTAIINDANDLVGAGIDVHIRVTRSSTGQWTLEADPTGGNTFSVIGSVEDIEFSEGDYFGFYVKHSSTRNQDFYFDDFTLTATPIPDTTPPTIQFINTISDTEISVQFSEDVDKITAETISNYVIDGGITVFSAERSDNQSIVHLTTSSLTNGRNYTLTINNVEDQNGNAITSNSEATFDFLVLEQAIPGDVVINEFLADPENNSDDFVELYNRSNKFIDLEGWILADESSQSPPLSSFVLSPESYLIIYDKDAARDYTSFGEAVSIPSLTLNNTDDQVELLDSSFNRIAFVLYTTPPDEEISYELVNPNDPCISEESYQASVASIGFTPGTQNSVFDDTPDTSPPTITSFGYSNSLNINFSEVMDEAGLTAGLYEIENLTINEVIVEGDFPTSVEITFMEPIALGQSYSMTVAEVTDCAGNQLPETTISFGFGRMPSFNELIITEIMFDEDPSIGLPDVEYLEMLNTTEEILSTSGVFLTDATKTVALPSFNLHPGEYVVLTTTSGVDEFSSKAVGITGFPSLNNSGEMLVLSIDSNLIFSITYDPDWQDATKADGGYSIEMVDVTNPCVESGANWKSSSDTSGGTPGRANSVSDSGSVPDNLPPVLLGVTAIHQDTLRLRFDEKIDPESLSNGTYTINPPIEVSETHIPLIKSNTLDLKLSSVLPEDVEYSIKVNGISDCNGNQMDETEGTFALPIQAMNNEIKLSEVLFNPRSNGVDFVEIYNDSDSYISLKNWELARAQEEVIEDVKLISSEEFVLVPNEYLVFTSDPVLLLSNYPAGQLDRFFELPVMPSYPNEAGNVVLLNDVSSIQEFFEYNEDFHYNLLEDVDGVSLERVSFDTPANNSDNWRSASSTVGFATPGYANSQSFTNENSSARIHVEPEIFIPGNIGSGRDFTTINYQFDSPGKFANVNIYDQTGRLVKNLANGASLSTSGFFRWDGDMSGGGMARVGYYLILFEIYDSDGNSETVKETVVVGRNF